MNLNPADIARMIDLSCVRTTSSKADIEAMVVAARRHGFGQVSVLQCFIPHTRQLIGGAGDIRVVGNVSFPTGSDTTSLKSAGEEMISAGCDEIDMVMNIGKLRSGLADVKPTSARSLNGASYPVKVIIEVMC
jgi:deoxyribose-phosphate aldolase